MSLEGNGRLTYEEFLEDCNQIIKGAYELRWELRESQYPPKRKYMVSKAVQMIIRREGNFQQLEGSHILDNEIEEQDSKVEMFDYNNDISTSSSSDVCTIDKNINKFSEAHNEEMLLYEYHVIYNESYNVPTMFFSVSKADGSSVTLDRIWKCVPDMHKHALKEKFSFVSQQEHPIISYPFYWIHPCHTSNLMKTIQCSMNSEGRRPNYLLMWLSAVGPIAGLNIPLSEIKRLTLS